MNIFRSLIATIILPHAGEQVEKAKTIEILPLGQAPPWIAPPLNQLGPLIPPDLPPPVFLGHDPKELNIQLKPNVVSKALNIPGDLKKIQLVNNAARAAGEKFWLVFPAPASAVSQVVLIRDHAQKQPSWKQVKVGKVLDQSHKAFPKETIRFVNLSKENVAARFSLQNQPAVNPAQVLKPGQVKILKMPAGAIHDLALARKQGGKWRGLFKNIVNHAAGQRTSVYLLDSHPDLKGGPSVQVTIMR